jgi:predicted ATPase
MQRVVLTGGPGSGKTTVLEILFENGYAVGEDAARSIIRERKAAGLNPRPEPRAFAEQVLEREIATYRSVASSPTFLERGVAEAVGSLYESGGLDDHSAKQLIDEYRYEQVFLFPPWAEIYRTDSERDHSFEHSIRVCEGTRSWYLRFGYDIVEVPLGSANARAEFVLAHTTGA